MIGAARTLAAFVVALVFVPAALAGPSNVPTGLHGFQLRADEPVRPTHVFARTPAFAWNIVPGATAYELQLSTSKTFADNALVWEDTVSGPLATIPLTLPWISGAKYSWFVRVRAVVDGEPGPWSSSWGFNMRASGAPRSLSSGTNPNPGMIRWAPVEGATSYEVIFLYDFGQGSAKRIRTATTAADLREYYTLHNDFPTVIFWRARAIREIEGKPLNELPVVSYGPWSAKNRTVEPALATGPIKPLGSVSRARTTDVQGTTAYPGAHELTPGFWWSGNRTVAPELFGACPQNVELLLGSKSASACPLYHVYVYSDADCVNRVHVSDLVGSPAYVPRLTGPLGLPGDPATLAKSTNLLLADAEKEGDVFDAGYDLIVPTGVEPEESEEPAATTDDASGSGSSSGSTSETSGSGSTDDDAAAAEGKSTYRRTSLWDNDFPTSRYYWVVVPAVPHITVENTVEYHDVAFPEDLCAAGQTLTFGKTSVAVTTTASGVPFSSGLSSEGDLVAATTDTPTFFGKPVIAWLPTPGAQKYELQWSKKSYPWKAEGKLTTPATTALLELPEGTWYYRVRGLDETIAGPPGLTWSDPAAVRIVPPTFEVVSKTAKLKKGKKARRHR